MIYPFIITFIAGISTLLGIIPTYINIKYKDYIIKYSLILSSLIMILVSINSLIPDAFKYLDSGKYLVIYIIVGMIISRIINNKIENKINDSLYKIGLISLISLIIHNIPEGIITYITTSKDINLGINLAFAIMFHNIPEGIIIAIPIYYSTKSRMKTLLYIAISGFSEIIGAILARCFLYDISYKTLGMILAIVAGIMIYISIFELLLKRKIEE